MNSYPWLASRQHLLKLNWVLGEDEQIWLVDSPAVSARRCFGGLRCRCLTPAEIHASEFQLVGSELGGSATPRCDLITGCGDGTPVVTVFCSSDSWLLDEGETEIAAQDRWIASKNVWLRSMRSEQRGRGWLKLPGVAPSECWWNLAAGQQRSRASDGGGGSTVRWDSTESASGKVRRHGGSSVDLLRCFLWNQLGGMQGCRFRDGIRGRRAHCN